MIALTNYMTDYISNAAQIIFFFFSLVENIVERGKNEAAKIFGRLWKRKDMLETIRTYLTLYHTIPTFNDPKKESF